MSVALILSIFVALCNFWNHILRSVDFEMNKINEKNLFKNKTKEKQCFIKKKIVVQIV